MKDIEFKIAKVKTLVDACKKICESHLGDGRVYKDAHVSIYHEVDSTTVVVTKSGQVLVYEGSAKITTYAPGPWEYHILNVLLPKLNVLPSKSNEVKGADEVKTKNVDLTDKLKKLSKCITHVDNPTNRDILNTAFMEVVEAIILVTNKD